MEEASFVRAPQRTFEIGCISRDFRHCEMVALATVWCVA
jgi:hypothetical protein